MHQFENVPAIMFAADLDSYDQVLGRLAQTRMMESLLQFESVVNSQ
jgi:hypothetical protein